MASPDCALARWIRPWRAIGFAAGAVCLVALSTRYLDGSPPPDAYDAAAAADEQTRWRRATTGG